MSSVLKRSFSSNPSISWRRQPIEGVSLLETSPFGSFKAFHGQRWTDGSLADGPFLSASTVTITLCGRRFTLFLSPYQGWNSTFEVHNLPFSLKKKKKVHNLPCKIHLRRCNSHDWRGWGFKSSICTQKSSEIKWT